MNIRNKFEYLISTDNFTRIYPDRTATFTRDALVLTQLVGIGMMELEEQRRREMVERQKEDMIREIAAATGQSSQMLRAINRRAYNAPIDSLMVTEEMVLTDYAKL